MKKAKRFWGYCWRVILITLFLMLGRSIPDIIKAVIGFCPKDTGTAWFVNAMVAFAIAYVIHKATDETIAHLPAVLIFFAIGLITSESIIWRRKEIFEIITSKINLADLKLVGLGLAIATVAFVWQLAMEPEPTRRPRRKKPQRRQPEIAVEEAEAEAEAESE